MSFWSAFVFHKLPDDERHKCYMLLREAHITAHEIGNAVLGLTKHVGDPDDPGVGDIVPMTEIILRRINSMGGRVEFRVTRLTDNDIGRMEAIAATRKGPIDFDEVLEEIRSQERKVGLLRDSKLSP